MSSVQQSVIDDFLQRMRSADRVPVDVIDGLANLLAAGMPSPDAIIALVQEHSSEHVK